MGHLSPDSRGPMLPKEILLKIVSNVISGEEHSVKHFVYILQCNDGRYYTGYTTDLKRRLKEHQNGSGGKFTRSFGAKKILYH